MRAPMANVPQYAPIQEQPKEPEPNPEQEGFTTKLKLTIPDNFEVGVKSPADKTDPNMENWKASGIGRNDSPEEREFRSRPGNVDTDCYFMLIERKNENSAMLVPVSQYLMLDPVVTPRTNNSTAGPTLKSEIVVDARLRRLAKVDDLSGADDGARGRDGNAANRDSRQRVSKINWDYEGAPSDDEELYPQEEADEPDEDPLNQPHLSLYGHKLRSLLQQQAEREVDDELEAYSDDEEGSQVSAPGKQQRSSDASESQSSKKAKLEADKATSIEERVTTFLLENNGKVQVKSVLSHFNITAKNEDFRLIQTVIQKRCTMSVEEKDNRKIKFIALKPEFMK
ncbi:hypothetical protein, conserved [Babesia bigemina]|uniref:Transcription initiation factor IIF subunit alpha n=1 Tax=Babesia bigemina TaxID=5866 RepID=A0A061D7I0_BABBI|nr:hypothetical protein, conserved [Babesia bigemina]CDR93685.1 hypothetical protein, conserved [Babesia bigemina]|eukprot:XP_012765871.1 hypothetical protein, conserved [Babesia bigemina]